MKNALNSVFLAWLLLLGTALTGCGQTSSEEDAADSTQAVTPVTITQIVSGPIAETIELNAVSTFQKQVSVKAITTGYIEDLNTSLGSEVSAGKVLFTIKTPEANALSNQKAIDSLFHFSGIIPIKAQKAGIITTLAHQKGDYVQEGDELAVIADRSSLVFVLQVPFEMNVFIKIGTSCKILLPGDQTLDGKISGSLPEVDAVSQTQQFIVTPLGNAPVPQNLVAKISIVKSSKEKTNLLPKAAILSDETQTSFWVMKLVNDSTAVKIPVRKGIENAEETEILEPAFTGSERFVLDGNYGLADTAKVSIEPRQP